MGQDDTGVPPPPVGAADLVGERLPALVAYANLLAGAGVTRGLLGAREVPRLWERHLLNCGVLAELLPEGAEVADLGSGAGLPGVVLALVRPDVRVTLVDSMARRTTYLEEVTGVLALENTTVARGRAESFHGKHSYDIVTSRALAPLGRLLEWSMPLVRPAGAVVAMKGARVTEEIPATEPLRRRYGWSEAVVRELGRDALETPTRVVVVTWENPERVSDPPVSRPGPSGPRRQRGSARGRRKPRRSQGG